MAYQNDYQGVIADLSFGEELSEPIKLQVVAILLAIGRYQRLAKNAILFRCGDRETNHGYVLLHGSVEVQPDLREPEIVTAPRLLGEAKQFSMKCERDATIVAREAIDVLRFEWDDFEAELHHRLEPDEQREVTDSLIDYTWSH